MQKKGKRNSTALALENGFIGRPFTNCFLHHYLKAPAFLAEGCPSGASGPLGRAVVDQQQCETTAMKAVVHIGAENETRTRDPDLGKVVLYQLSYFRVGLQR